MITLPLTIKEGERILVVAPHPDDESIGVGGLACLFPGQIEIMVMTDGRYGSDGYSPQDIIKIRRNEFDNAMKIAHVNNYRFFDVEDGTLIQNETVFDIIDYSKYNYIFLPNPKDNHDDHTACYEYVIKRIKDKQLNKVEVYQYEVHKPLADVDYHIDITDVIDNKSAMLHCHKSQMSVHNYEAQVRHLAEYRGEQNEHPGRSFEVYKKINIGLENSNDIGIEVEVSKYKQFTRTLSKWVRYESLNSRLGEYLYNNNYKKIAIYGFGVLGKILYDSLRNSKCKVLYVIDKNKEAGNGIVTYHYIKDLPQVDIVLITTVSGHTDIIEELKNNCNLTSIYIGSVLEE